MSDKTYISEGEQAVTSQIGATFEALGTTIAARRDATDQSYTHRLLTEPPDTLIKKIMEEAQEVALAAKDVETCARVAEELKACGDDASSDSRDVQIDHLRYEAADLIYHLMVLLDRYDIGLDELAAELNNRMTDEERPYGSLRLFEEYVHRGK